MLRRLAITFLSTLALWMTAVPPVRAERELEMKVRSSGTLTATWQGDRARGCDAAGVCGVSGLVTYQPVVSKLSLGSQGGLSSEGGGEPPLVLTTRDRPGLAPSTCMDLLSENILLFDHTERRLLVSFGDVLLSGGRCAGPRPLDLFSVQPYKIIEKAALRKRGQKVDLSGSFPFTAGAFSGTVVSSVRMSFGRGRFVKPRDFLGGPTANLSRRRSPRYATLTLVYELGSTTGSFLTEFRGVGGPTCRLFDACGARGSSAYALEITTAEVNIVVSRRFRGGRRPTVFPDGPTCQDSLAALPPDLTFGEAGRKLVVAARAGDIGDGADPIRSRCSGPSRDDTQRITFGRGDIPVNELGRQVLRLKLRSQTPFSSQGYDGTRSGELPLVLRLVKKRAAIER